ncbi:MAG: serine protease, partial [Planctomycetota bacterium]
AAWSEEKVGIFERGGAVRVADFSTPVGFASINTALFSPDGQHLALYGKGTNGQTMFRLAEIPLTNPENARLRSWRPILHTVVDPPPAGSAPASQSPLVNAEITRPALSDLAAMNRSGKTPMNAKGIAAAYGRAVVLITHDGGSGTGFFIGPKGYLLTCDHVLPRSGDITVTYQDSSSASQRVIANIISRDPNNDIALLSVSLTLPTPYVLFNNGDPLMTGEKTVIIGNPGVGNQVLHNTMTEGIISNPDQTIDGISWIQTSAAINPGCSGGPMFDEKGNVVGMVVAKAHIENAGFAIPRKTLMSFLKASIKP